MWLKSETKRIQTFIPYFLALILAIPVLWILPEFFPKYKAELEKFYLIDKHGGYEYYCDLDHDGFSERIVLFNNTRNEASVKIIGQDGTIREHYYFRGRMFQQYPALSFCDFDFSGSDNLFLFTICNDSLLLHFLDPGAFEGSRSREFYIATLKQENGRYDCSIFNPIFSDLNSDGKKEMINSIMAGFTLRPRVGLILDLAADSVIISKDQGSYFYFRHICDINNDGRKDLFPVTYSIYNYPDSNAKKEDDYRAWFMILDNHLEPLFPPIEFPGKYIHVSTCPVSDKAGYRCISLLEQKSAGNQAPRLIMSDPSGHHLGETILPRNRDGYEYSLFTSDDQPGKFYLNCPDGTIQEYDSQIKKMGQHSLKYPSINAPASLDIDGDKKHEWMITSVPRQIPVIYRNNFTYPVALEIPSTNSPFFTGIVLRGGNSPLISVLQEDKMYLFHYRLNSWYYMRYSVFLGVYIVILSVIQFSQYLQRRVIRQRLQAERKLSALQLHMTRNQLDPHFTFNALNAISASILNKKPGEAHRDLIALSRLMLSSIAQSGSLSRTITEEVGFLRDYLDLMKSLTEGAFEFEIRIDPAIDLSWQVPRMVIHTYAENALKHGLMPKNEGGALIIGITPRTHGCYVISIEDNGIGRAAAAKSGANGAGQGTQIMEQFYGILNRYNKEKITCEIIDMVDPSGYPCGTRVEISIPGGMRYEF